MLCGVDEVGRGPLAGPVVAAAVILPDPVPGVADSKALSRLQRERLFDRLMAGAIVALGAASAAEIDRVNILRATLLAMTRAVARLPVAPGEVIVDGNRAPAWSWPTRCVVKADATVAEVGAASVAAKVVRDRLMAGLARRYPAYGWERNAGYPTRAHLAGMAEAGISRHHRLSFAPVAALARVEEARRGL